MTVDIGVDKCLANEVHVTCVVGYLFKSAFALVG